MNAKAVRLWHFYRPLVMVLDALLFMCAVKLNSWLQLPLAALVVVFLLDAVVELWSSLRRLWRTVKVFHER